jgi:hypothetical protein
MNTEDNIVELTQEEYDSAMAELLTQVDQEQLGRTVAGVLEFLTVRAIIDGPFYLMTDDEQAITVIAANEDASALRDVLPENFKSWEEYINEAVEFITDRDMGDEQDEPASEQE